MHNHKLNIRRLDSCSLQSAVEIWNESFEGYRVDLKLSLDGYITRLHNEALSPEYSLIAFLDGDPVGFLLNGIRTNAGTKVAWNGGTGVSPKFRGQGAAKQLLVSALDLYAKKGVELATLEAISDNESAINLYQKFGYEIVDRLVFLRHERGAISLQSTADGDNPSYSTRCVPPQSVANLDFYDSSVPWQAQWQSMVLKNGEGLIIADATGDDVGYALFTRKFDAIGGISAITLFQCRVHPEKGNAEDIVACLLERVYAPLNADCLRSTHNLSRKNDVVLKRLEQAGFATFIEQVHMAKTI